MRLSGPKAAILLFRTGKMVCAGAKSEAGAAGAVRAFAGMPASRGIDADPEPDVRVRNMVATLDWKGAIRLEKAALSLPNPMYEPEMFPGLACRPPEPKCTILLFAGGKLVCAGARSEAETARGRAGAHCAGGRPRRSVLRRKPLPLC